MSVVKFLLEIKELHVFVTKNGDKLSIKGNREALTTELKENLSNHKADILALFDKLSIDSNAQLAPTAFAQQRLWILDKVEGGISHYNMPSALELCGDLDLNALNMTLNALIERHETLRTNFVAENEEPYQVIRNYTPITAPLIDLSEMDTESKESEIKKLILEETRRLFCLESDLMIRWLIIKASDTRHILVKAIHHIASDGWSLGVLAKEFKALYLAFSSGKPNPLTPLKIQYADYAHWQRQWLKGEVLEKQLNYWREKLKGIPPVHSLPTSRPRPASQSFNGKDMASNIPASLAQRFSKLCVEQGATLFMGLNALFSLVLSRYSGETDIVIGTPIANREQPDIAPLNGFFLNTLVLRSDLSTVDDFIQLLEQSKNTAWEAYGHQQVPFEQLVKELKLEQSLSYPPIFQIMMILQNNESSSLDMPGIQTTQINTHFDYAKFELTFTIIESDEGFKLGWNFNTDIYDEAFIWLLAQNFEVAMRSVVEQPRAPLEKLKIINEEEYEFCTKRYNNEKIKYDSAKCAHEVFEEFAHSQPDAIALVSDDCQLSYRELNYQANKLAYYLLEQNIKPADVVAIAMPRVKESAISLLAILKIGAIYLPIDIDYPVERINYILENAKVPTILCHSSSPLNDVQSEMCTNVDEIVFSESLCEQALNNISTKEVEVSSNTPAYVIYTSGSTGKPKGVQVSHSNIISYINSTRSIYGITTTDRIMQFSSFSFDIYTEEFFGALLNGASLIFRNDEILNNSHYFWYFILQQSITIASLPTAYWQELCLQLENEAYLSNQLALMVVGGEAMSPKMLTKWQQNMSDKIRLLNTYGPTEATVISTTLDVTKYQSGSASVPIGQPIPNVECYVLDKNRQVCPINVKGELWIAGPNLSPGYLHNEEMTSSKFVEMQFEDSQETRFYRTGDIVRMGLDGNLEFIERNDHQIKIRGYRVEISEIEYHIKSDLQIDDVVVVAKGDSGKNLSLIAYVMLSQDTSSESVQIEEALKRQMRKKLPSYMVPSTFVVLDEWPLTANGKVDRDFLLRMNMNDVSQAFTEASTETETVLVQAWAKLLEVDADNISTSSSFFELGGHSLLAIRLVAEIEIRLGIEITIKTIFEYPDIKSLGALIDSLLNQNLVKESLEGESSEQLEEIEW